MATRISTMPDNIEPTGMEVRRGLDRLSSSRRTDFGAVGFELAGTLVVLANEGADGEALL
jgi:hypothetical protein